MGNLSMRNVVTNKKKESTNQITVVGAREHNLKDITVSIPKEALTVITGPSGSGKSSLALDILYTEGKRRYIESLSSYARQFLGLPKKPDIDRIDGLCPAIAIDQKTVGSNPRSTVGTITEIYDYLRVLYARAGTPICPACSISVQGQSAEMVAARIVRQFSGQDILVSAPIARYDKGEFIHELEKFFGEGYHRFLIDGTRYAFKSRDDIKQLKLKKTERHSIDVLIDVCPVEQGEAARIEDAVTRAFGITKNIAKITIADKEYLYSADRMCIQCGYSFTAIEPRLFSFNSPIGACKACFGLGTQPNDKSIYEETSRYHESRINCTKCAGKRLCLDALSVTILGKSIYDLGELSIKQLADFVSTFKHELRDYVLVERLIDEIASRLSFLIDVGLSYLSLNRTARTLSGGEGQRIRLATQVGSALSGVVYILDEPSIGLHQRDNDRLINTLHKLRNLGNTVVVVEHDVDTMQAADYLIDMGPAAGVHGGEVVASGTPQEVMENPASLTGAYLLGKQSIERLHPMRKPKGFLTLHAANANNLRNLTISFPLGLMCGISGVSGSGKSTLIMQELVPTLSQLLNAGSKKLPAWFAEVMRENKKITGAEQLESLVVIDQSPIGRTSRSTPATYMGVFDAIRSLFASLPESTIRGYKVGRFSFNVAQGRCTPCSGEGSITVPMHFLADVVMTCTTCKGTRYNQQTLEITYKDKNIAQILDLTIEQALAFFGTHTQLVKKLQLLCDVGLGYLKLGQPSTTLSGGEAQRIKLASELTKRGKSTLYILDEPTTGLHAHDIKKLLEVLNRLVEKGNTLIVIEHNLDVLKTVDHLIDLGPEGGDEGGSIVAQGTPQEVAQNEASHTGRYLRSYT